VLLLLAASVARSAGDEARSGSARPEEQPRRYDQGPVNPADFQGTPPVAADPTGPQSMAYTSTAIRYQARYEFRQQPGRVLAWLTDIDIFSVFMVRESWCRRPADAALLAHEQGHFDLTEAGARQAQLKFRELLRRPRSIAVRALTRQGAIRQLSRQIEQQLQPFQDAVQRAHRHYDQVTSHGTRPQAQREQRQAQVTALQRLQQQLRGSSTVIRSSAPGAARDSDRATDSNPEPGADGPG
jgi:hypothetical protein